MMLAAGATGESGLTRSSGVNDAGKKRNRKGKLPERREIHMKNVRHFSAKSHQLTKARGDQIGFSVTAGTVGTVLGCLENQLGISFLAVTKYYFQTGIKKLNTVTLRKTLTLTS